jgi:hypothetical protein
MSIDAGSPWRNLVLGADSRRETPVEQGRVDERKDRGAVVFGLEALEERSE